MESLDPPLVVPQPDLPPDTAPRGETVTVEHGHAVPQKTNDDGKPQGVQLDKGKGRATEPDHEQGPPLVPTNNALDAAAPAVTTEHPATGPFLAAAQPESELTSLVENEEVDMLASDNEPAPRAQPVPASQPGERSVSVLSEHSATTTASHAAADPVIPAPSTSTVAPRYTVHRVVGNSAKKRHVLSLNDSVTDANSGTWPTDTTYTVHSGRINWFRPVARGEQKDLLWRCKIGDYLAIALGIKQGEEFWILDNFPLDYKLFEQNTAERVGAKLRLDAYLYGNPRFRSPYEANPHFQWLLQRGTPQAAYCLCKYCSGNKSQRTINTNLGVVSVGPGDRTTTPAVTVSAVARGKRPVESGGGAQKKPRYQSESPEVGDARASGSGLVLPAVGGRMTNNSLANVLLGTPFQGLLVPTPNVRTTRTKDPAVKARVHAPVKAELESLLQTRVLKAPTYNGAYSDAQRDLHLRRGPGHGEYRVGELVWVELAAPIVDPFRASSSSITHWPAVVQDRRSVAKTKLVAPHPPLKLGEIPQAPKIRITHSASYIVHYLGIEPVQVVERRDAQVLPWLGLPAENEILSEGFKSEDAVEGVVLSRVETLSLREAKLPFALALQAAVWLVDALSPRDRFNVTSAHIILQPNSTEEAIANREEQLGSWHFQSAYRGPELIYTGEFVRLLSASNLVQDQNGAVVGDLPAGLESRQKGAEKRSFFFKILAMAQHLARSDMNVTGALFELRELEETVDGGGQSAMKMFENGNAEAEEAAQSKQATEEDKYYTTMAEYIPAAPEGYAFHLLCPPNTSISFPLDRIAGRYYPLPARLASKASNGPIVQAALARLEAEGVTEHTLNGDERLCALAGLLPAQCSFLQANVWVQDRQTAVINAERQARADRKKYFEVMADRKKVFEAMHTGGVWPGRGDGQ